MSCKVIIHYIYDAIHCDLFSTIMQLHYNYTHNVMLTSLIVIHLLKYDMWHYEDLWTYFLKKILISIIHYDCQ
jgi:hypothetical protein